MHACDAICSEWNLVWHGVLSSGWHLPRICYICEYHLNAKRRKEKIICRTTRINKKGCRVLQSRFIIICGLSSFWDAHTMKNIIYACIILHNMIVENEWHTYQNHIDYDSEGNDMSINKIYSGAYPNFILTYLQRRANVRHRKK